MKISMNSVASIIVALVCLFAPSAEARLGAENSGEAQQDDPNVVRRLPHFITWDSDTYIYHYGCDNDGIIDMKNDDGDEIVVVWSEGGRTSCSASGDVSLKRGAVKGSFDQVEIYVGEDGDHFLLTGKVGDTNLVMFGETSGSSRRRLEDGILSFDVDAYIGGVLELDRSQDRLVVKGSDGSIMRDPSYKFQAKGSI
ncbi:expressed unknown protein [Seminavis robusta]|uniref:Uncharacterized protein n=1 Tax=Seminavis robusta TaxID=568900 RepID=A0A9N8DWJ7_9STRA|nr:expressed unknown protein [Seminavis robusta]|eukprot:Sro334_g119910.1 n/a (197) ;mRNA; r:62803-63393